MPWNAQGRRRSGAPQTDRESETLLTRQQLTQDILQDPAMFVVEDLLRRIDAHLDEKVGYRSAVGGGLDFDLSSTGKPACQQLGHADDVVGLFAGQAQGVRVLFVEELQGQDSHADQV